MLAGGLGVSALVALPDMPLVRQQAARAATVPPASGPAGQRYLLLYGTVPETPGGGMIAPASSAAAAARTLPQATPLAASLAAAPVLAPDQSSAALITVASAAAGAEVTLRLVNSATAAIEQQATLTIGGVPAGTQVIATPVFAAGTTTIALVLGITVPTSPKAAVKKDAHTGADIAFEAVTWVSHHALAYFDTTTGAFSGPFDLGNSPALALHTAAANSSDLFLWTTAEPQQTSPKGTAMSMPSLSAFPLGSGKPRFTVPALLPWPGHEPVVTLADGNIARFVNGRTVQVVSAATGDITQKTISALSARTAKPGAVTMTARPDGTVFLTKPAIGRAVIADPAKSFAVKAKVDFPVPGIPTGGPAAKAVLSQSGDTLFVLGSAKAGGVAAYDVASGTMTGSISDGTTYAGLYLLPSGNLLATAPDNPRLAYFSSGLDSLGTASTSLAIAEVF